MPGIQRIGNVFYRVPDLDTAIHFYGEVLGFSLKFRDADRWAAFDVNGATLAIEGGLPGGPGGATVSLHCESLSEVVSRLAAKGATVSPIEQGPHERRATLTDPASNLLVLYEPA